MKILAFCHWKYVFMYNLLLIRYKRKQNSRKFWIKFWRTFKNLKTYKKYLSQYVCNISLSILDYCVFVSDLYLHLYAFPMAIVIWPLQNRSFGIILEMCPDWRETEPLCGLVLLSNGFSDFIHNVKISRGKVIQETSFHLQTQHSKSGWSWNFDYLIYSLWVYRTETF